MTFEEGAPEEGFADGEAEAEVLHGGVEVSWVDVAAVAGDEAVVGEGVDDGAGASEVGGCGGVVVAPF